jgi:hypothetical protein
MYGHCNAAALTMTHGTPVDMFILRPFLTTKDWLFHNPKWTPYSLHRLFKLRKKVD